MRETIRNPETSFEKLETPEINSNSYMRGEPVEAMTFTLIHGLRPESYREKNEQISRERNDGNVHKSHITNRVSLGKGMLRQNVASMQEFGGSGNVIYLIDTVIENSKTFRPNSLHPNNAEFLIKGANPNVVKAIIAHDMDRVAVEQNISELENIISSGAFPIQKGQDKEQEKQKRLNFIRSLPIISFEEQLNREKK